MSDKSDRFSESKLEEALMGMDSFDADEPDGNSMDSGDMLEQQFNAIKGAFDE